MSDYERKRQRNVTRNKAILSAVLSEDSYIVVSYLHTNIYISPGYNVPC